jgi:PAS domain S-box-containing protein
VEIVTNDRREAMLGSDDTRFLDILENWNQGVAIRQGEKFVFVNRALANMYGYDSPEAVLSLASTSLLLSEHERERLSRYRAARAEGVKAPLHYELQIIRKDGSVAWFENRVQNIVWNGNPAVLIAVSDIEERKQGEDSLIRREADFKGVLDGSTMGIFIVQGDQAVYANSAFAELYAYENPEAVLALDSIDPLGAPAEYARFHEYRARRAKGLSVPPVYEFQGQRKDGSLIWLENHTQMISWLGEPALLVIAIDISERQSAQEALLVSQQRLHNVVQGSIQGVAVFVDNKPVFANPAMANILGHDGPEDIVRMASGDEFLHPDEVERLAAYRRQRLLGKGAPDTYEVRGVGRDGSPIFLEARLRIIDWDGEPAILGTYIDISDRKQAEATLYESEQRFRSLAEGSIQGVAVHRGLDQLLFANEECATILGYDSLDDAVSVGPIEKHYHPEERDRVKEYDRSRIRGEPAPYTYEARVIRKDGSTGWIEVRTKLVEWDDAPAIQSVFCDITDRKRAEGALKVSEELYRSIIDNMQDTYFRAGRDGQITMVSPSVMELLGYSADEFIGIDIASLYTDSADYEQLLSALKESNGTLRNYVTRIRHKDGSVVSTSTNIRYRRDGDGHVIGVEGTTRDITATEEAEDAARKSEARAEANHLLLLDAIESLSEGFVLFDSDDRLVMTNQRLLDFYEDVAHLWVVGEKSTDIVRSIIESGFIPEARDDAEKWLRERMAHHRDSSEPIERRLGSGRTLLIDERRTRDGGTVSVVTDITKLKQAESELRVLNRELEKRVEERTKRLQQSEERQRIVMDGTVDGIIVIDSAGVVESFSRSAARMFGYEAEEVIGRNVSALMPEPYRSHHDDYINRYLASGQAQIIGIEREVRGQRKDGSTFAMELAVSEVGFGGNRLFTGLVRDITERKKAEQELVSAWKAADAANRAKSEFLSSMSHELRTPLNAILGFAQLQRDYSDRPLSDEQQVSVQQIIDAGQHLLSLISDVLDLSKIESGNVDVLLEPFDPVPLIGESLTLVKPIADKYSVSLIVERTAPPGVQVMADSSRLKQVLLNLLSNAIKYNRRNGTVALDVVFADTDMLRINITDTGAGIPADKHDEVFRPFSRLGKEASTIEGTGVGLTISRQLIESMGGNLDFHSTVGEGSTFWIEVPVAKPRT